MSPTLKEMEAEHQERWTTEEMDEKMNVIHHMDCLDFMKRVPDDYFDLCLTDPPYGIDVCNTMSKQGGTQYGNAAASKSHYKQSDWDKCIPTDSVFYEIQRIAKNCIIFGGNYFASSLPNSSCWIFWDKDNGSNNFADGELAWTNFKTAVRKYDYTWNGMIQQDMANKEKRHHPTQKPTELFKMILRDYAIKLDKKTVFDPFGGSGTTVIAAKSLGLDWCICELEEDYCKIAEERLKKVQLNLF